MDFFEDIMSSIPKSDDTDVVFEKDYKDIVDKVSFNFDANIKKDIQNLVKLEMRVKKCKEKKGCMDKQSKKLIDKQISDIKERIKKYKSGLDDPAMKEGLEVYIKKCYDDYGPSSLFYASISVPDSVKESEEMIKDESISEIITESTDEDDSDDEDDSEDDSDDNEKDSEKSDEESDEDDSDGGSDVKSELLDKIQAAFDDADYKLKISDKNREAFINNKKSFMTNANGICLVLGKNDYNKKKELLKEVVGEYKDDFSVSEDNYFTCFVNVKPKSSLYVKNVKESVYSLLTDDIDTYIESPYITDEDYMLAEAARDGDPTIYGKPVENTNDNAGDNATPNNENKTPEEKEFCIAAMLPQCGSTDGCGNPGDVMKDIKKVDKASDKNLNGIELPDDIEIENTLQEYVNNLNIPYDMYVENAVGSLVDKVKTNAKISKEALRSAADRGLAKARYARAKFDVKVGEIKDNVSEKLHGAKAGLVDAEKKFRNKRKKLNESEAAELNAVAEKVFEKFNEPVLQEVARYNINKTNHVSPDNIILAKEGCEMVDERDELVEMLEKAMNENNMDVIKTCQNKIKYIDNREQRLGLVVTLEAANIDDEIKPVIEELNRKGYKTKYSSAGHTKLRKKEDGGRDGVYYGKLYSDARIMFDDDYDFPKAPKHWVWKSVEGKDYLDIIPQNYDSKDGTPDEAFAKWKANYMGTLRTWVDNLPEKSKTEDKVVVKDTKGREKVNE